VVARPTASSAEVRTRMERQARRDTKPELALRRTLHRRGLRYRVDYKVPGMRGRVDVAFTRAKVAVFVHGCFWHSCPEHATVPKSNREWWREKLAANVVRDRAAAVELADRGWVVLVVWEHEEPASAAARVSGIVRSRRDSLPIRG
jgi:DNA mismatch endonuclease (patch repair protein)